MLPTPEGLLRRSQDRAPRWSELREMAQLAEAVGFDGLWVGDHLLYRNRTTPPFITRPGQTLGVWEAFTVLSALAAVTSRVTLGSFTACTGFRNPALLAKMADTLDEISGGRVILALGAGWHQPEYEAFGYPFDHRVSRFEEALQILVPLLRHGHVDFQGHYYQARDCELRPRGPRPEGPPIWIGAERPRMMRLAARYADAFDVTWCQSAEALAEPFAQLDVACREVGRDPATIMRTVGSFVTTPGPRDEPFDLFETSLRGTTEEIITQLQAFQAVGVQYVTCLLDPPTVHGVERMVPVIEALATRER
jgi:probable F420-dependent oxidoreductase